MLNDFNKSISFNIELMEINFKNAFSNKIYLKKFMEDFCYKDYFNYQVKIKYFNIA